MDLDDRLDASELDVELADFETEGLAPPHGAGPSQAPPETPPVAGSGGGAPRATPERPPHARWLVTFVVCLFGALELQTILVMFATSDAGGGATSTLVFGGIFLASVVAWFIGGMLWFARQFDRH